IEPSSSCVRTAAAVYCQVARVAVFAVLLGSVAAGCSKVEQTGQAVPTNSVPTVVTADIQAGIEKHIDELTRSGNGFFRLAMGDKLLSLKLVRVHTEYLANLGPRRHFACVDLVDTNGDVYDVDFFLTGDPGTMIVTETMPHKINGQPYYVWEQKKDLIWRRVPTDKAPQCLLGVITGNDEFDFLYRATLPAITNSARMWLPYPSADQFQTVVVKSITAPGKQRLLEDLTHSNKVLFLELGPGDSGKAIEMSYHVQRREKAAYASLETDLKQYLKPELLVPSDSRFSEIAEGIIAGKSGDLVRARALYDHVIDRMRYMKYGTGWGNGDALYACDIRTGNCTDFHAYFIALARSAGIPARFAIGVAIPSERYEGGIDGYHCWAEFYADGKWWPVDISEADKYSALASYYFGHHPANRLEFSHGRDLTVAPAPAAGTINFLAYPVLEIDGRPTKTKVEFSFQRIDRGQNAGNRNKD
ncbi:MAG: transglutaminase domain-containing protein, partial [bacterium]